jgi:co-chaperonin GroES (HSP10)
MANIKTQEVRGGRRRLKVDAETFENTFKPLFDFCLIKMTPREQTLPKAMRDVGLVESGIVNTQTRNKDGVVINMGPCNYDPEGNKVTVPPGLEIGARVYYSAWSGQETPCPPGYILVRVNDILALLDKDAEIEWI